MAVQKKGSRQQNKTNSRTALETAASYLASRMRTVFEVRQYLKDKGYSSQEIDDAVTELIGLRYLDDYLYAVRYYEYSREKLRGSLRAMRELEDKGIDKETVRNAYEDFIYENKIDEFKDALKVAEKELYVLPDDFGNGDRDTALVMREVNDKLLARIGRKLESRGFRNDDIYRVLSEVRRMGSEDKGYN